MTKKSLFWADQIARKVKERAEKDDYLKKTSEEKGFICLDEKTPSGHIHIGSGRGWIIHDTVAKAMRDNGMDAKFILSADDYDPFDKIPSYLEERKYNKYLGVPFKNIPSPRPGYDNYADYYFKECTEKFEEFGIEAEIQSTGKSYIDGKFNEAIKIALDNADKIQSIYERIYEESVGTEKLPFNPICEECGKLGTTLAYEWDKENEVLKYKCEQDLVDWAEGCGHEGEISPYDGNGKLPWKVEWAAKWFSIGVAYETAGKDHFTRKGSREVSIAIADEVYDITPPYPSTRKNIGRGYEFFTLGGKKMSTSKGVGANFASISEKVPPKMLRYLLVRTRPKAVIDFDPVETNKLLLLYNRYDRTERIYFDEEEDVNEKDKMHESRIYELAHVGKLPKKLPPQVPLGDAAMVIQAVNFDKKKAVERLKGMEAVPEKLDKKDKQYLNERLESAENWIKEFAPEQYKFVIQPEVPPEAKALSSEQKQALRELADVLEEKEIKKDELESEIFDIAKRTVGPKKFFQASYKALIGKSHGPRLGPFIMSLDKEFVIKRLNLE
ncbi:MAG: lysine--tRNA ligase [Candidatus Undinarchaeales archaeon]